MDGCCFFLEDPGVDGLNIRSFEPYSDAAMQETTRTFFKEPGGNNPGGEGGLL